MFSEVLTGFSIYFKEFWNKFLKCQNVSPGIQNLNFSISKDTHAIPTKFSDVLDIWSSFIWRRGMTPAHGAFCYFHVLQNDKKRENRQK